MSVDATKAFLLTKDMIPIEFYDPSEDNDRKVSYRFPAWLSEEVSKEVNFFFDSVNFFFDSVNFF